MRTIEPDQQPGRLEAMLRGAVERAVDLGRLPGYLRADCAELGAVLARHVNRHDAVEPADGVEWHPHVDLLRVRQQRPGDDEGRALAYVLGVRVERARMLLSALRDLGLVDWDGPRTQIRHLRILVQDGRPIEREGVVIQFPCAQSARTPTPTGAARLTARRSRRGD